MQPELIEPVGPRQALETGFSRRPPRLLMTLARAVEAEELRPSLESLGWEVLVAADEAAGMEVLGGRWPDVILTDRTASAALWRAAVQDDSVVIVLADETDDISQGYVNGADLVLFRPLDVERLVFFRRYSA